MVSKRKAQDATSAQALKSFKITKGTSDVEFETLTSSCEFNFRQTALALYQIKEKQSKDFFGFEGLDKLYHRLRDRVVSETKTPSLDMTLSSFHDSLKGNSYAAALFTRFDEQIVQPYLKTDVHDEKRAKKSGTASSGSGHAGPVTRSMTRKSRVGLDDVKDGGGST